MVTGYIDGPSLAEYIDEYGCLTANMLYGLATGLAEALTVIHAAGVHRDLKPSNVILRRTARRSSISASPRRWTRRPSPRPA